MDAQLYQQEGKKKELKMKWSALPHICMINFLPIAVLIYIIPMSIIPVCRNKLKICSYTIEIAGFAKLFWTGVILS